ncbi:zf-HC2 domain-containing protein [Bilifractor porci]|nr:zf-HC2 domain-containing protein [Bilifractor porci]
MAMDEYRDDREIPEPSGYRKNRKKERHTITTTTRLLTCREIISMIPDYLNNNLSDRQLEKFLEHIQHCSSCYEELETNFMVDRTVRYLDKPGSGDTSFNLKPMLRQDLERKQKQLKEKRISGRVRLLIILITLLLIVLLVLDVTGVFKITVFLSSILSL